jgi:hypothetical protein
MKTLTKIFKVQPAWGSIALGLVICSLFLLPSCSEDPTPSNNLIGTWTSDEITLNVTVDGKTLLQYYMDEFDLTASEAQEYVDMVNSIMEDYFPQNMTIQFKSDNTYTSTTDGEPDSGTWSLSSDEKKLTTDAGTVDQMILDVIELTSSKLDLQVTQNQTEDINGDEVPETLVVILDMTFTK